MSNHSKKKAGSNIRLHIYLCAWSFAYFTHSFKNCMHSFIKIFTKYLYTPATVLGTKDEAMNKTDIIESSGGNKQ